MSVVGVRRRLAVPRVHAARRRVTRGVTAAIATPRVWAAPGAQARVLPGIVAVNTVVPERLKLREAKLIPSPKPKCRPKAILIAILILMLIPTPPIHVPICTPIPMLIPMILIILVIILLAFQAYSVGYLGAFF